ncbi:MAG TPA: dihydroneopterin aldolase, partial [Limnochordia bacterium]|nr:dihydroneopterin aldolase [Limnochordia bacterium]
MSDRIVIRDMVFYGYHGVFEAEREMGQRFEVDVELHLDLRSVAQADDIDEAINYVDVYTAVKDIVEEQSFRLIESLAEAIAQQLLTAYDVKTVIVRVRKPHAPIGGV